MRKTTFCFQWIAVMFLTMGIILTFSASAVTPEVKTLDNLMTAFNGESNARAKYLEYAKKADEEGYKKLASLFRAASSAEEIHLKNHARVISTLGGTPKAEIKLPVIGSTMENLEDALKGENYERITMYPEFISLAQKEGNADAVRTFTYAKDAETEHARLYQAALDSQEAWKTVKADFYVCPTCGYTVMGKPDFASCPVCMTPAKLYQTVN